MHFYVFMHAICSVQLMSWFCNIRNQILLTVESIEDSSFAFE